MRALCVLHESFKRGISFKMTGSNAEITGGKD